MQLRMPQLLLLAVLSVVLCTHAEAQQKPSRGLNAPAAPVVTAPPGLDVLNAQRVGQLPAYDNQGDAEHLHGIIRIHGTELTQHLIHAWEDGFLKQHPLPRFEDKMWPTGFSGLAEDTADINVMGHDAWYSDLKALEAQWGYDPQEIQFATGGFNLRKGNTPATIFFVNRDNPLANLSIDQIDGIFGAERTGGWKGTKWDTSLARGPEKNIRTWGQLGLTGEWVNMPIHVYGLDATLSNWSKMVQDIAFHGGDKWNEQMQEIVRGGVEVPADAEIVADVAKDKYAIGFNLARVVQANPGVRALLIGRLASGPFVQASDQTCYDLTYPFVNKVVFYIHRVPGQPIRPVLKAFLTYVLSREGQQAVIEDGMYIPLNPKLASSEIAKLQ